MRCWTFLENETGKAHDRTEARRDCEIGSRDTLIRLRQSRNAKPDDAEVVPPGLQRQALPLHRALNSRSTLGPNYKIGKKGSGLNYCSQNFHIRGAINVSPLHAAHICANRFWSAHIQSVSQPTIARLPVLFEKPRKGDLPGCALGV